MPHLRTLPPLLLLGALILGVGCGPGRDYEPTQVAQQQQWTSPTTTRPGAQVALSTWWRSFGDSHLDRLIALAIDRNLDLQIAWSRVDEARATRSGAEWEYAPQGGPQASAQRNRYSANAPLSPPVLVSNTFDAEFDASWEIDLFGGLHRGVEAASAQLAALQANRNDVMITMVAETARAYFDLIASQEMIVETRGEIEDQQRLRDLVSSRRDLGVATDAEVAQAEALLASTAALLPDFENRRVNALTRLSVLLAFPAGQALAVQTLTGPLAEIFRDVPKVSHVPDPVTFFAAGLPSDLVWRRPDLRRAERQFAASVAAVGVAAADFYPRFSLTGSFGLQSEQTNQLTQRGSQLWSIGPSVRWPLLDFGLISTQVHAADARSRQAELAYQQAVLVAFADVENALTAVARAQDRTHALAQALTAHEHALGLIQIQYEHGTSDLTSVLTEQRAVSDARLSIASARYTMALAVVTLAKALGGGWDPDQSAGAEPHAAGANASTSRTTPPVVLATAAPGR